MAHTGRLHRIQTRANKRDIGDAVQQVEARGELASPPTRSNCIKE
jgi:hypothetical protein